MIRERIYLLSLPDVRELCLSASEMKRLKGNFSNQWLYGRLQKFKLRRVDVIDSDKPEFCEALHEKQKNRISKFIEKEMRMI